MVVYADVLVVTNLLLDGLLLRLAGWLAKTHPAGGWRFFAAAALGGISSLLLLLPAWPDWLLFLIQLGVGLLMVWLGYGFGSWRRFVSLFLWQIGAAVLFGGSVFAVWYFAAPSGLTIHNHTIYLQVTLLQVLGAVCGCYGLVWLVLQLRNRTPDIALLKSLQISTEFGQITLQGLIDTGNHLTDPFTGQPVIVCELQPLLPLFPPNVANVLQQYAAANEALLHLKTSESTNLSDSHKQSTKSLHCNFRCLPCQTAGSNGLMLAFVPDLIEWIPQKGKPQKIVAVVGICHRTLSQDGSFHALLPPLPMVEYSSSLHGH